MDYKNYKIAWENQATEGGGSRFRCGHCGADAGVIRQLKGQKVRRHDGAGMGHYVWILFCPVCTQPSYVDDETNFFPTAPLGADLKNLPKGIEGLYREARDCSSVRAYTACVMVCRKILMNLAVLENAKAGLGFVEYVDYLAKNNFVPPKGRAWVDRIRSKGNEANHEIKEMLEADAKEIMMLVEMLLRFNFELGEPPKSAP